jgi:hypothetical protein
MQTSLIFSISSKNTTIPYPSTEQDDSSHQGFVTLRGNTDATTDIPSANDNAALCQALVKINGTSTPFFTAASKLVTNSDPTGFWVRGYLEFCLNSLDLAKDSPNYFLLFEQFHHFIQDNNFDMPVEYNFELRDATLTDIQADVHTVSVWITTSQFPNEDGAIKNWNMSIAFLADFLSSFEKPDMDPLYPD